MKVVQPPQRIQPLEGSPLPLLPIDPPKIDSHALQRVEQLLKVHPGEVLAGDVEADWIFPGRVKPQGPGSCRVLVLMRMNAVRRVQVKRGQEAALVQPFQ